LPSSDPLTLLPFAVVEGLGHAVCHLRSARRLSPEHLLCARCMGIYLGFAAGWLAELDLSPRKPRSGALAPAWALLPLALGLVAPLSEGTLWPDRALARTVAGLALGLGLALSASLLRPAALPPCPGSRRRASGALLAAGVVLGLLLLPSAPVQRALAGTALLGVPLLFGALNTTLLRLAFAARRTGPRDSRAHGWLPAALGALLAAAELFALALGKGP